MASPDGQPKVELLIRSPALRRAMESYLGAELSVGVLPRLKEASPGVLVVTTSSDLAPADCTVLVRGGARVLVLLVFASDALMDDYRAAGAEVLVMGDERTPLAEVVRSMLPASTQPDDTERAR